MSDEDREPVEVWCLASYLAEEMIERDWTSVDVGMRMGGKTVEEASRNILTVDLLLAVQDDKLSIGTDLYRALESAFGVSEGFFERLDEPWHKFPDRRASFEAPEYLYSA